MAYKNVLEQYKNPIWRLRRVRTGLTRLSGATCIVFWGIDERAVQVQGDEFRPLGGASDMLGKQEAGEDPEEAKSDAKHQGEHHQNGG